MKKLLVALLLLGALLVVADRGGAVLAERAVADQARSTAALPAVPDVDITGFPFLTQALGGRYDRVEVSAVDVPAGELVLSRLDATLTGVRLPLSDAVSGAVSQVPVDSVDARVVVAYAELSRRSADRQLTVEPVGDRVRVTGSVEVLGRQLSAAAVSRVEAVEGSIVVTAEELEVGNEAASNVLTRALRGRLDLSIPVTGLPYGLGVTGLEVRPEGLRVRAGATDVLLG